MPTPHFYNSLTKRPEPFDPKEPGKARLYHCGPTVYKRQHLGNMRRFLFADFLRRSLEFLGYEVHEVTNITDVGHLTQDEIDAGEDKLARAARAEKVTPQDIAERETKQFMDDIAALNIQPSHEYPHATAHIQEMQNLIARLLEREHAYTTTTGVYFDVQSFPDYGKLSGNTLEQLEAGKRIDVREEKKHPADFALWIFDDAALQKWDSPWGTGYPGWHIECSAMSLKYLGSDIDIHTGGEDNRFPHHENEIAQSEAATGERFVRTWMHNRHLQLSGKKLAKREGEQLTLDTVREKGFSPLAFRLLVFSSHYRTPLEFSWESLTAAQENIERIKQFIRRVQETGTANNGTADAATIEAFGAALADDLNTPQALAVFNTYLAEQNKTLDAGSAASASDMWATLLALDQVLGAIEPLAQELDTEAAPVNVTALAEQREAARASGDFARADELRGEIEATGYTVEDTDSGPRLIKKA